MDIKEAILSEAFLLRASPETVYEWLKARSQRTPEYSFWGNDIPKEIEFHLLGRRNEIVDLGLAAWGTQDETLATLYQRWCARSAVAAWPPQPSTFPYAVLAAILANVNAAGVIFGLVHMDFAWLTESDKSNSLSRDLGSEPLKGIPKEDFDWLIEHGDDNLLSIMHSNIGPAIGLLKKCSARSDAYGRIGDDRWLTTLAILGRNKRLQIPAKEYDDAPDLTHWEIHEALVEAAGISPKTNTASDIFWGIFIDMPTTATEGAYIKDEALSAAVSAWNVEISNNDQHSLIRLSESDALTPAERVQFHLLRHYCLYLHLDPDDPVRVRRLAAYSKNPVNGGKGWELNNQNDSQKYTGKGLDIESFQRYSERDGPAFMYANSFNRNIWCDKVASEPFQHSRRESKTKFPHPEDEDEIFQNRQDCVEDAVAEEPMEVSDSSEESGSLESRTLSTIVKVREELGQVQSLLNTQIGNLKKWLIWGGAIVVVLLLFRH